MSKYQIARELRREIKNLNRKIDLRIIHGLPYRDQARRHKLLVSQLKNLLPKRPLFGSFSLASMFML